MPAMVAMNAPASRNIPMASHPAGRGCGLVPFIAVVGSGHVETSEPIENSGSSW